MLWFRLVLLFSWKRRRESLAHLNDGDLDPYQVNWAPGSIHAPLLGEDDARPCARDTWAEVALSIGDAETSVLVNDVAFDIGGHAHAAAAGLAAGLDGHAGLGERLQRSLTGAHRQRRVRPS